MSSERSLPTRTNPLLQPEHTPLHEILVERRCHAQTNLSVRPGLVNTSNATKSANLYDRFDYVHLRVPLPKDLTGSEIFSPANSTPIPESYFLMRRSSDGFISATGMFKAAFPWASKAEEQNERKHIKSLPATDPQEIAGNLWVPPEFALDLAIEYGLTDWIIALLDNEIVELYSTSREGPHKITSDTKPITSPPPFTMPPKAQPNSRKLRATSREVRSESPMKMPPPVATPGRPKKTPRKPRVKKMVTAAPTSSVEATPSVADSVADSGEDVDAEADELSTAPATGAADTGAADTGAADTGAEEDQNEEQEEEPLGQKNVRVSVQEEVQDDGHTTTTHTTVKVELPASSPDLKLPTDTEGVVEMAKNMIEGVKQMEAAKMQAAASEAKAANSKKSLKRSRDEYEEEDVQESEDLDGLLNDALDAAKETEVDERRPAKRARLMVEAKEYRKEKVQKRALMGLSGALAFGLIIPAISTFWA